jgi:Disulphide bond corrector protein DsbC
MKFFYTLFLLAGFINASFAQSDKQVKWSFTSKKIADKVYEVHMKAEINGNFHLYAQNAGVEGPVPTLFKFVGNPLSSLDGKVKEMGKLVKKKEAVWGGTVNFYQGSVEFVQLVKLKGNIKTTVAGSVEFMVCDDSKCLPPSEVQFKVNVGG